MNIGTFYQTCAYICMCLIAVNLAFAFVTGLGVFGNDFTGGVVAGEDAQSAAGEYMNVTASTDSESYTGMNALWIIVSGSAVGAGAGLLLGFITHSSVFVGIGLFSGVFWSSYLNSLSILDTGGFLSSLEGFVLIGTALMVFMFAGAVIGMLSGSG